MQTGQLIDKFDIQFQVAVQFWDSCSFQTTEHNSLIFLGDRLVAWFYGMSSLIGLFTAEDTLFYSKQ